MRPGIEIRDLPDGLAVLDIESEAVHVLNPAAAFVLSMCDGTRSVAELAEELRGAVPDLSEEQALADVEAGLRVLRDTGLIEAPKQ